LGGAAGLSAARSAAAADTTTWFAYAGATTTGQTSCPQSSDPTQQCSLAEALANAQPGEIVALATPGTAGLYIGNWSVAVSGTTAGAPLTIEPAAGVAGPTLDGGGAGGTCSTASCSGPVLVVGAGVYLNITGITVQHAANILGGLGGAIANNAGGTLTVTASIFADNSASHGGAIDNGDSGAGALSVVSSTFTGNSGSDGGAIDNGDNGSGTVSVTTSTFTGNTASDGGAVDNADEQGSGTLSVTSSTLSGNEPVSGPSSAIDNGDDQGNGTVWAAANIFDGTCSRGDGAWHDGDYNVSAGGTCLKGALHDVDSGGSLGSLLGPLTFNQSGTTQTMAPLEGNPAIGAVPYGAKVLLEGVMTTLCPTKDQNGTPSMAGKACDAGSVQTDQVPRAPASPLTVTAPSPEMDYGAAVPGLIASYTGFVGTDTAGSLSTLPTCTTTATSSSPVGTYPVTCSGAADSNYIFNYVPGTLTVRKASLRVAAPSLTMTYGTPVPALAPTYEGFVDGGSQASLATAPSCSTTATSDSPVGTYAVTCSGGWGANYSLSHVAGTLTVSPANLTVSAQSYTVAHGSTAPTLDPQYSGFVAGDGVSSLSVPASCTTTAGAGSAAGSYPVTCSGAVDSNYTITYVAGSLRIASTGATVSAPSFTVTYGSAVPALVPVYSGLAGADSPSSLTSRATCTTTATASSPVGSYPVTCGGALDANYTFGYIAGTMTVRAEDLLVTAPSQTVNYGSTIPGLDPAYSGFAAGDTASSLARPATCSTAATSGSPAAVYAVTCSGGVDDNYRFDYVAGTITVSPVALSVKAPSPTMVYGASLPDLTPSYAGLVSNDSANSLGALPSCTTTASSASTPGTYPVTCAGGRDPNYIFTYLGGQLTVTLAPLKVVAPSPTMIYGAAVPNLVPTYQGFVGNDSAASLTANATCTTTATSGTAVGAYPVTCSGARASDYAINYVTGTITISPAQLTVSAPGYTIAYGAALPTLAPVYSGYVGTDSPSSLAPPATCTTTAPTVGSTTTTSSVTATTAVPATTTTTAATSAGATSPGSSSTSTTAAAPATVVGSYPVTCSGAVDSNYTITYVAGTLNIGPAGATVSAPSFAVTYGSPVPALVPVYSGFAGAANPASLPSRATCSTTATASSPVGTYAVNCSGATDGNYTFDYVAGTITVGKATLTIAAPDSAMTYGSSLPKLQAEYSGFVAGDAVYSLVRRARCTTTAKAGAPVGAYPVQCAGAVGTNYTFHYVGGRLAVHRALLDVAAPTFTMARGATLPMLAPSYYPFANGDSVRSLSAHATCSTQATPKSPAGAYRVRCSGAVDRNYRFDYLPGTLTLKLAPVRAARAKAPVVPASKSKHKIHATSAANPARINVTTTP
jgi:hypothetical protein